MTEGYVWHCPLCQWLAYFINHAHSEGGLCKDLYSQMPGGEFTTSFLILCS